MLAVAKPKNIKKIFPYWPQKLLAEGKIHGGKSYLCRRIFSQAPKQYERYADLFGGMGSMSYNAPAGLVEQIFCDINADRINVKCVIKEQALKLSSVLKHYAYTESAFEEAKKTLALAPADPFERAVSYLIVNRMSRGGLGTHFSFTPTTTRLRGGQQAEQNAWDNMIERLPVLGERLQTIRLMQMKAQNVMVGIASRADAAKWFLYLDPTYMPAVRSTEADEYGEDEMTVHDHEQLVEQVREHPSKIAISHYPHPLYDSLGWRSIDFNMPNHAGQKKTKERRTERLYMNY